MRLPRRGALCWPQPAGEVRGKLAFLGLRDVFRLSSVRGFNFGDNKDYEISLGSCWSHGQALVRFLSAAESSMLPAAGVPACAILRLD